MAEVKNLGRVTQAAAAINANNLYENDGEANNPDTVQALLKYVHARVTKQKSPKKALCLRHYPSHRLFDKGTAHYKPLAEQSD